MRGRGLKPLFLFHCLVVVWVAPHAGAWIETLREGKVTALELVAPHAGAWIETSCLDRCGVYGFCRPPCGGVD